ncbi:MAG: GspH/FimT family pseudopilin [Leptothrix ochracea]|uniref:GspH/FimT family pseudopilin n=1 Tax=Leptothrix ochracea TaxID=735331 RepID=UPI0034E261B6
MKQQPHHRGFTIIELMVTIAIIAVVMFSAIPSMSTWLRNTQVRTAAESLQAGLQKARAEAVRRNTPVTFSLVSNTQPGVLDNGCNLSSLSASWVVSVSNDPSGGCGQPVSESVAPQILAKYARGDGAPNVTVTVYQADCTTVSNQTQTRFNGFGRIDNAEPIRCLLVDHDSGLEVRKLRLVIGTGGSVRMCDPAVTNDTDPRKCY